MPPPYVTRAGAGHASPHMLQGPEQGMHPPICYKGRSRACLPPIWYKGRSRVCTPPYATGGPEQGTTSSQQVMPPPPRTHIVMSLVSSREGTHLDFMALGRALSRALTTSSTCATARCSGRRMPTLLMGMSHGGVGGE